MISMDEIKERVILVAVDTDGSDQAERSLDELGELAKTAGAEVVGRMIQPRENIHPGTYIGKGKILELKELLWETHGTGIICAILISYSLFPIKTSTDPKYNTTLCSLAYTSLSGVSEYFTRYFEASAIKVNALSSSTGIFFPISTFDASKESPST